MSEASNLGYGASPLYHNVNNSLVNTTANNNPANFSSNESGLAASGGHGMLGASNNANAAAGCLGGLCNMTTMQKGGTKSSRRKKNMRNKYRMKHKTQRHHRRRRTHRKKSMKHRSRTLSRQMALYNRRMASLSRRLSFSRNMRGGTSHYRGLSPAPFSLTSSMPENEGQQKGGYHQYMGNVPNTPSYAVGGPTGQLSASNSALANPPPITTLSNCTNCVDNYNHMTNKGFQLWN